jgi:galactoside 2-L-fucosyltransferase 1/2
VKLNEVKAKLNINKCTLIGVHVRRGDFTYPSKHKHGHEPANETYIHTAMTHFRTTFKSHACIRFLIVGNDLSWNIDNIHQTSDVVFLKPSPNAAVDLCVLASCQHTIATTGSFSWWAAFLANGNATFQRHYARKGSVLDRLTTVEDVFLPEFVLL